MANLTPEEAKRAALEALTGVKAHVDKLSSERAAFNEVILRITRMSDVALPTAPPEKFEQLLAGFWESSLAQITKVCGEEAVAFAFTELKKKEKPN